MPVRSTKAVAVSPDHPLHDLNVRERQFALFIVEGKSIRTAMKLAGYADNPNGREIQRLMKEPRIVKAVNWLRKKNEESIVADRKMVLEGFLDAIQQAKLMGEPMTQIAGWREIGKMCGYYAPEVKEVNVTIGAKRVLGQLEVLSDQELLELIEKDREVIEATAIEVLSEVHTSAERSEPSPPA